MSSAYLRQRKEFVISNGILHHKVKTYVDDRLQVVLPEAIRLEVFKALHDNLGRDCTISLFKERFFWPKMDEDIAQMVRASDRCVRRKILPTRAKLVPIT